MIVLYFFAVRSSIGINFESGPPQFGPFSGFTEITSKSCRTMLFSPNGQYFSYVDGSVLVFLSLSCFVINNHLFVKDEDCQNR